MSIALRTLLGSSGMRSDHSRLRRFCCLGLSVNANLSSRQRQCWHAFVEKVFDCVDLNDGPFAFESSRISRRVAHPVGDSFLEAGEDSHVRLLLPTRFVESADVTGVCRTGFHLRNDIDEFALA